MNTKNTASPPKVASIADDVQFISAAARYFSEPTEDGWLALAALVDSKLRAPADQAASVAKYEVFHADQGVWYEATKEQWDRCNREYRRPRDAAPQQSLAPAAGGLSANVLAAMHKAFQRGDSVERAHAAVMQIVAAEGQVSAAAPADERANFEAAILSKYPVAEFSKKPSGDYAILWVQEQWQGWQLRASEGQAQTSAAVGRYTCIGKGGLYEYVGVAKGAGTSKDIENVTVYRDCESGDLYYRTTIDFALRMEVSSDAAQSADKPAKLDPCEVQTVAERIRNTKGLKS